MGISIVFVTGLVSGWVGERIVESTILRIVFSGAGLLLVAAALIWRLVRAKQVDASRAAVEKTLAKFHGLSLAGLVLYLIQSDIYTMLAKASFESTSPQLSTIFGVLWPILVVVSLFPALLIEVSYQSMARAQTLEARRLSEAMLSGLGLAFALIFVGSAMYVASERDIKVDLSHFRPSRPGEATIKLVASIDEPLNAFLFFPSVSDTGTIVADYFDELARQSPLLQVTKLDQALDPMKAKELGVTGNGTVVVQKGARKESFFISTDLEKARNQLRSLDSDVQKRLLLVAKSKRTVYFTSGHGERTQQGLGGADQRSTVEILATTLADQNFEVKTLSSAEGLAQEVPKDAAAVFILGPQSPFLDAEVSAIDAYVKRGGRMMIALDPEVGQTMEELLAPVGLTFRAELLAQEREIASLRPPPSVADRINIGTRAFSSHPSVTFLGRYGAPVLMVGAGPLDTRSPRSPDLVIDFAVRSNASAWNDVDRNFTFSPESKEVKKSWGLVAAITRKEASGKADAEARVLVLGDSDGIADQVLPLMPGNQYLALDGFKWLLGDEQLQGTTSSEVDVPLSRSKQLDNYWFYGTTFLGPALILGLGFGVRRRIRKAAQEGRS